MSFVAILICESPSAYAAMVEYLNFRGGFTETSWIDFCVDQEVNAFLDEQFPQRKQGSVPTSDLVLALYEKFPPAFAHKDVIHGIHNEMPEKEYKKWMRKEHEFREKNYLNFCFTVKSPEEMRRPQELGEFLVYYSKWISEIMGPDSLIPDDLETTRRLLAGKKDIILPEHRQFVISLPPRDVTNSIRLLNLVNGALPSQRQSFWDHSGPRSRIATLFPDPYYLQIEVERPDYMHLLMYIFAVARRTFRGIEYTLVPV